jgi:hypothetical protein
MMFRYVSFLFLKQKQEEGMYHIGIDESEPGQFHRDRDYLSKETGFMLLFHSPFVFRHVSTYFIIYSFIFRLQKKVEQRFI